MSGFVSVVTWALNAEAFPVELEDYFLAAGLAGAGWWLPLSPRSKRILCQQGRCWPGRCTGLGLGQARGRSAAQLSSELQNRMLALA